MMEDNENRFVVEAEGVSVAFRSRSGTHRAVDGFSFSLERGASLAVVGQSGSGKTTLMRTLLGLVPPTEGHVRLFGRDLEGMKTTELASVRRRCGYVPQDPYAALPPGLTALKAVMEPAIIAGRGRSKRETRDRAVALLAELGLTGDRILNSRAVGLSGGQRQRVELARALMLDPELLLCDEPTSMQDVSTRGEIVEVLRRRMDQGMSLLFVTHDLKLAAGAARHIAVMHEGRLCEENESRLVLSRPTHPYTRELLAAIPVLP